MSTDREQGSVSKVNEMSSGLLFHEDERPQLEALTCVWCDCVLVSPRRPDRRTLALWMNRCCASCATRYSLDADVPGDFTEHRRIQPA